MVRVVVEKVGHDGEFLGGRVMVTDWEVVRERIREIRRRRIASEAVRLLRDPSVRDSAGDGCP